MKEHPDVVQGGSKDGEVVEGAYELDPKMPIANFYVAWNGTPGRAFFQVYPTLEEAKKMTWVDKMYKDPLSISPEVSEWKVGISKDGDPVIIMPDVFDNKSGSANVPYSSSDFPRGSSYVMSAGVPLRELDMGNDSLKKARNTLLEYYRKYSVQ